MNKAIMSGILLISLAAACQSTSEQTDAIDYPASITIENIAQNPEGIEYHQANNSFFLSSINAAPIIKVNLEGGYEAFTSGEAYPMSTAGLQIDNERNRLLAASFNGTELMDEDPDTKGLSNLRIYNLESGVLEMDINLSSQAPAANAYFANDIAIDGEGNAYVSDWYAGLIYKVDLAGNASLFWVNETGIPSGPNGLDFHPDGYLLVSILVVNELGLYADYGLVKIPTADPTKASVVAISDAGFTGFDGMVLTSEGNIIGITNDGETPGGNSLIELSSEDNWGSAKMVNTKAISASTTVAITPENLNYVIHQDFQNPEASSWSIEKVAFR